MTDRELQDRLNEIIWRNVPIYEQKTLTTELSERFVKLRFYKNPEEEAQSFIDDLKDELKATYYALGYVIMRIFSKKRAKVFLQKQFERKEKRLREKYGRI